MAHETASKAIAGNVLSVVLGVLVFVGDAEGF